MSDEKVMKDLSEIVRDMTGRNVAITHRVIIEKALPGTGWRGTFSAVRLIDDGDRAELMFDCEYCDEWKD